MMDIALKKLVEDWAKLWNDKINDHHYAMNKSIHTYFKHRITNAGSEAINTVHPYRATAADIILLYAEELNYSITKPINYLIAEKTEMPDRHTISLKEIQFEVAAEKMQIASVLHDDGKWPHKKGCLLCGADAYVGFNSTDCSNVSCLNGGNNK